MASGTTYSIKVSNLSPTTALKSLQEFFGFCGKIVSIDFQESSRSATIAFDVLPAAKTALMLNGGSLDGASIEVTSEQVHTDQPDHDHGDHQEDHYKQSDKPRAGIAAEYLARGYGLSDTILQRAIEIDQKQGISTRFLSYMKSLDQTIGQKIGGAEPQLVSAKVQATLADAQQHPYTKQASDYYAKAIGSPFGQKVYAFYTTTSKQVADLHEEARRIADQQKVTAQSHTPAAADSA